MSGALTIDIGHLLSSEESTDFVPVTEFNHLLDQHAALFGEFREGLETASSPITRSLAMGPEIAGIKLLAEALRHRYRSVLVIGIGGSTLGFRAVVQALRGPHYNLAAHRGGWPTVFVVDNVDPAAVRQVEELIDIKQTAILCISKSGSTAESAANFLHFYRLYREAGNDPRDIVFICDKRDNGINRIGKSLGCHLLHIPDDLGGRYSVLSPVGFLPSEIVGVDSNDLLAGAVRAHEAIITTATQDNPVYTLALCLEALARRGKTTHVLLNYSSLLSDFGLWFAQLWAESLGKEEDLQGRVVHSGTTPLPGVGATDQHSLLQLFKQGPGDKVYGFVQVAKLPVEITLTNEFPGEVEYGYFGGHTLGEQLGVEQASTEVTLVQTGRPCYRITLPDLSARTLGSLFYFMEALTAFTGKLWNIDPFTQPGVEAGKHMTYALMGRTDYQDRRAGYEDILREFNLQRRELRL
jgi:glucose-6-phosphate isomerase